MREEIMNTCNELSKSFISSEGVLTITPTYGRPLNLENARKRKRVWLRGLHINDKTNEFCVCFSSNNKIGSFNFRNILDVVITRTPRQFKIIYFENGIENTALFQKEI